MPDPAQIAAGLNDAQRVMLLNDAGHVYGPAFHDEELTAWDRLQQAWQKTDLGRAVAKELESQNG